jgi:DNA-binding XRE family transcriptional regulator
MSRGLPGYESGLIAGEAPSGTRRVVSAWATDFDDDATVTLGRQVIGAGIRAARLGLGMSQRQLGRRAYLSPSAISRLETGRLQGLRQRTLARVVGVLQASPGYAFPGGPPPPTRRLPGQRAA